MGERRKNGQFAKGNKVARGNGRPPLPPEVKEARKLTRTKAEELLNRFAHMTKLELEQVIKAPESTQLKLLVASILKQGIKWGEQARLTFVLVRLVVKVKE